MQFKKIKQNAKRMLKKHFFRNVVITFISLLIINGGYSYVTQSARSTANNRIVKVSIKDETKKEALALVNDKNLSLAIGKKGQNVKLASRLTHYKIEVKPEEQENTETTEETSAEE